MANALVIDGRADNMREVRTGSVQLIVTSPPFFTAEIEKALRLGRVAREKAAALSGHILNSAQQLELAFNEIARVLDPSGTLVLHTKDIRVDDMLIPLAAEHEAVARLSGFYLTTRISWMATDRPRRTGAQFSKRPALHAFRAPEVEYFCVMRRNPPSRRKRRPIPVLKDKEWLSDPVWRTEAKAKGDWHPHAGPREVFVRLLSLFSSHGDLVLDPFCGGAGVLAVARDMGRNAIGYEIDPEIATAARESLAREN